MLDELFKGAHVEGVPKVSPSAAVPSEVGFTLLLSNLKQWEHLPLYGSGSMVVGGSGSRPFL